MIGAIKFKLLKKTEIVLIVLLAAVINYGIGLHISMEYPDIVAKEYASDQSHVLMGKNLVEHGIFSKDDPASSAVLQPTSYRVPGLPVLYAMAYLFVNEDRIANEIVKYVFLTMNIVIVYLVYRIGLFYSYRIGYIAAILATVSLSEINFANNYLFPDTLLAFLSTLFVYFLLKYIYEYGIKNIALASFFLGLAALTKPTAYLLWIPLTCLIFSFIAINKRGSLLHALKIVGIFVAIQLLLIGGWKLRNYISVGTPEFISMAGSHMLKWNVNYLIMYQDDVDFFKAQEIVEDRYAEEISRCEELLTFAKKDACLKQLGLSIVLDNPIDYLTVVVKNIPRQFIFSPYPFYLFSKDKSEELEYDNPLTDELFWAVYTFEVKKIIHALIKYVQSEPVFIMLLMWTAVIPITIFVLFPFGLFLMLKQGYKWGALFLGMIVLYYLFIISPVTMIRYRAPVMPMMYVAGSFVLVWLMNYLRSKIGTEKK